MKIQRTIQLDKDTDKSIFALQQAGKYDSFNQTIIHVIQRGLDVLRNEYKNNAHTLPSKPPTNHDPYGRRAWDEECQELYGEI